MAVIGQAYRKLEGCVVISIAACVLFGSEADINNGLCESLLYPRKQIVHGMEYQLQANSRYGSASPFR